MKLRSIGLLYLLTLCLTTAAQPSKYDLQKPFGFCTRLSRSVETPFDVTGGGCYTYPITGVGSQDVITLTSNGLDMRDEIRKAIEDYRIIVLDGSKGDFLVSSVIELNQLKDKTLLGINNARLCTVWYATKEILDALNAAGVPQMSTSGGGSTLVNGRRVGEEAEYNTRRIIIEMTGDQDEQYRQSGIFLFRNCQNLIVRNLKFVGPGSIDVGGSDLMTFNHTTNCWVDHCDFSDGMDGNFDITQSSDFNTISWCTFSYTERSYMHQNTNLIGFGDREATGYLNTTFAFNHWGTHCRARQPMARVGKIHMLNNYYTSAGCGSCVNPRKNSEFLVEGNYFGPGVKNFFSQTEAVAVTWGHDNYVSEKKRRIPLSYGPKVSVPYPYTVIDSSVLPEEVGRHAGATLF